MRIFLIILLSPITLLSKSKHFESYYPGNQKLVKLNIKSKIDSGTGDNPQHFARFFDNKGRVIKETSNKWTKSVLYEYFKRKNILFKVIKDPNKKGQYRSVEKFIYKNSRISRYVKIMNGYNGVEVEVDLFYNKNTNLPYAKHVYRSYNHLIEVLPESIVDVKDIRLYNVINYDYFKKPTFNYIIEIEMHGKKNIRSIDTFQYDKKDRLIKKVSFAQYGYIGELGYNNLSRIHEVIYKQNKKTETRYNKYQPFSIHDEFETRITSKEESVFNTNGLPIKWYYYRDNGERILTYTSSYEYF